MQPPDPIYSPPEHPNALQRLGLSLLRDPRDLPILALVVKISLVVLPMAAVLLSPLFRWWMVPIYAAVLMGAFFGPFMLMLHNFAHRRIFREDLQVLDRVVPWVLGPFFGQTPETYVAHHIGMHHPENNLLDDLSTTMPYRRDSIPGFLHYFATFFFRGIFDLASYHRGKQRGDYLQRAITGELLGLAFLVVAMIWNPVGSFWVFVVPFVGCRFGMMAGNWGQHAFVDGNDPSNPYRNSITCIDTTYNRQCFNDGYHADHHVKANRHWTEHPQAFVDNLDRYRDNDAIVFRGLDHFFVWGLLMLKRYDVLADRFVDLRDDKRSHDEIIALLKSRVEPIHTEPEGVPVPA